MTSEAAQNADFSRIRYAQCWEDADALLGALDVRPGDTCLSIASAGDNALALLARAPVRVVAVDLNPAQLACLELRVAAYRELAHAELLELIGSRPSTRREALYLRCRPLLATETRAFWDAHPDAIRDGIGGAGKFDRYFALFRNRVLPLVHGRKKVGKLLAGGTLEERRAFYEKEWDSWRWKLMFRVFFSRAVMGRAGRDPAFFKYVEGSVATRILQRARYALTELNPAENPYLHWILTGTHGAALPFALREENFDAIRANLDRLEWRLTPMETFLDEQPAHSIHRFNLSDIFEYISPENTRAMLEKIVRAGASGARLAYWNTLAPRSRPDDMADQIAALENLATTLHAQDKAFFYCRFVVEEILTEEGGS
jgi:S-adenosylmethionine-diacylglycerol 3-amino-3-carboxypropyl transferase